MESAFPPFKAEHRYRGVYERAGFDVNLGGPPKNSDSKSLYSNKSKHKPRMPPSVSRHQMVSKHGSGSATPSPTNTHFQAATILKPVSEPSPPKVLPYATTTQFHDKNRGFDPRSNNKQDQRQNSDSNPYNKRVDPVALSRNIPDTESSYSNNPYGRQTEHSDPYGRKMSEHSDPYGRKMSQHSEHSFLRQPEAIQRKNTDLDQNSFGRANSEYSYHRQADQDSFGRKNSDLSFQRQADQNSFGRKNSDHSFQRQADQNSFDRNNSVNSFPRQDQNAYGANPYAKHTNPPSIPHSSTSSVPPYPVGQDSRNNSFANINNNHAMAIASPPSSTTSPVMKSDQFAAPNNDDTFNFSPSHEATKNFKNLKLDLSDNLDNSDDDVETELYNDTGDTTLSQNFPSQSKSARVSTQEIAPNQQQQPEVLAAAAITTMPNHTRLSCMFQDFKKDVEHHKAHKPKSGSKPESTVSSPPLPQNSPSQLGLARFQPPENSIIYNPDHLVSHQDGDVFDPSTQFKQFQQNQNNDSLNTDYHRFLNGDTGKNIRHSQLSTVSSIISKGSIYDDDEDDEIERELAKQLESLKTNGPARDTITAEAFGGRTRDFSQDPAAISTDALSVGRASRAGSVSTTGFEFATGPPAGVPQVFVSSEDDTGAPAAAYQTMAVPQILVTNNEVYDDTVDSPDSSPIKPLSVRPHGADVSANSIRDSEYFDDIPDRGVMFDDNVQTYPAASHDYTMESEVGPDQTMFNDNVPMYSVHNAQYAEQDYNDSFSSEPSPVNEPITPIDYDSGMFLDEMTHTKPLSPKNHSVEEELNNMNFKIPNSVPQSIPDTLNDEVDDFDDPIEPLKPKSIDAILAGAQPKSKGFTPFPTSADFSYRDSNTTAPSSHSSAQNFTAPSTSAPTRSNSTAPSSSRVSGCKSFGFPPGEGPCRFCHLDVSPYAKGPMKSIYSKTGELLGQWHRQCFSCAYPDCQIQFNKSVQCYAFEDNPYCHHHYHELNSTLCGQCNSGIEGECIENELKQKWHLNCLKCEKCFHPINNDYFLINNQIFCENDAQKIISGQESYNDRDGKLKLGGLSTSDRIEKRRTRVLFVD